MVIFETKHFSRKALCTIVGMYDMCQHSCIYLLPYITLISTQTINVMVSMEIYFHKIDFIYILVEIHYNIYKSKEVLSSALSPFFIYMQQEYLSLPTMDYQTLSLYEYSLVSVIKKSNVVLPILTFILWNNCID